MIASPDPTFQRHWLRVRLRRSRIDAKLTQREVAEQLGWSESKLLRIEAGQTGISRYDLKALLGVYGVTDPGETAKLVQMAKDSRRQPWGDYRDVLHPEYLVYLRYEGVASRLRTYQPWAIPGLLQTERYALRLIEAFAPPDTPERTIQRQLAARMARQNILERQDPPQMSFIIDETAVRRSVGTAPDSEQVLQEQLQRLKDLTKHPTVTIQVLPFSYSTRYGMDTSMVLLDLALSGERLLYLEGSRSSTAVRDDTDQIELYDRTFAQLEEAATHPRELAAFLDKLAP